MTELSHGGFNKGSSASMNISVFNSTDGTHWTCNCLEVNESKTYCEELYPQYDFNYEMEYYGWNME